MCRNFVESNPDLFSEKGKKRSAVKPMLLPHCSTYWYTGISTAFPPIENLRNNPLETSRLFGLQRDFRPDHWTISDFRKENGGAMKSFLKTFRRFLKDRSNVSGERIVFDDTKVKAYAHPKRNS